ncbi:MAG TPA: hypothetical protein VG675_22825 [Bryobacteraceae bacterium]|nr:hypothetical protein [Bryobacteraceae bacterium]
MRLDLLRLSLSIALVLLAGQPRAEAQHVQTSAAQARKLEADLQSNPHDRAARGALLDYYFLDSSIDPAEAVPARRRLILWLIENAPADPLAGTPAATIDASGHRLADPEGFKLASAAWRAQAAKKIIGAAALVNAAYFFKLSDKPFTISLLERALALEPSSKEIGARLGDEYALAIMGVTMVNKNGYPLAADPVEAQSATAQEAREALQTGRNPYVLAKAGYMLSFQGTILYYSRKLAFDTAPLAEAALQRAVSLAPHDRDVANYLEQHHEMQREIQSQMGGTAPARTSVSTAHAARTHAAVHTSSSKTVPAAKPVAAAALPAAAPPEPVMTVDGLKEVKAGMTRDDLLKLGKPAGSVTMNDDGHMVEIFQYYAGDTNLGSVRLTDGTVSSVQIP